MTNNDILESINNIDSIVLESEMNVIKSLIDSYNKSLMILENYEGDNLDSFELFNESFIMEADDNASTDKEKESIIRKILLAIPRLFMWLAKKINSVWKKNPINKLKTQLNEAEKKIDELTAQLGSDKRDIIEKYDNELKKKADATYARENRNLALILFSDKEIYTNLCFGSMRSYVNIYLNFSEKLNDDFNKINNCYESIDFIQKDIFDAFNDDYTKRMNIHKLIDKHQLYSNECDVMSFAGYLNKMDEIRNKLKKMGNNFIEISKKMDKWISEYSHIKNNFKPTNDFNNNVNSIQKEITRLSKLSDYMNDIIDCNIFEFERQLRTIKKIPDDKIKMSSSEIVKYLINENK